MTLADSLLSAVDDKSDVGAAAGAAVQPLPAPGPAGCSWGCPPTPPCPLPHLNLLSTFRPWPRLEPCLPISPLHPSPMRRPGTSWTASAALPHL